MESICYRLFLTFKKVFIGFYTDKTNMKKSVKIAVLGLFLVMLATISVMLTTNVAAAGCFFPSSPADLGVCDGNNLGEVKVGNYLNDCGSAQFTCTYKRTTYPIRCAGYFWGKNACVTQGEGVCCSENSCGYKYLGTTCDSCLNCDREGSCNQNLPEWYSCQEAEESGYCLSGSCNVDVEKPVITNNQGNIYIRDISNRDAINNLTIDVDFSDNLKLREFKMRLCDEDSAQYFANRTEYFPAPIIIDGCAEETVYLEGVTQTNDWKLSPEMWDFIIDTVLNQGRISMSIDVIDGIGNANFSNELFFIISDFTKPEVSVSQTLTDVPGGKEAKVTVTASDSFNEFEISVFIDDIQIGESCTSSPCERTQIYSEGPHTYHAYVIDSSGNNVISNVGTFNIETGPSTCEDYFGQVCSRETVCSQDVFSTTDTGNCCLGTCTSTTSPAELPTCDEQNGKVFNPNTFTCNGDEVAADDLGSFLRCCVGSIEEVPDIDLLEVFWVDLKGNKLLSASFGDVVKCSASGTVGTADFSIEKSGEELSSKELSIPGLLEYSIDETGVYECVIKLKGSTKRSDLIVIEAPARPNVTALPGFGWINALAALSLVMIYYLAVRRYKNE